jgi:hypothetical protein
MATKYRFCFGPWNLSPGQDPYGPPTRVDRDFDWKLEQLRANGFEAMMFHDDDAVPDIDNKQWPQIQKEAKALKKRLDNEGIVAEMVAPRLWFAPQTVDWSSGTAKKRDQQLWGVMDGALDYGSGPQRHQLMQLLAVFTIFMNYTMYYCVMTILYFDWTTFLSS